MDSLGIFSTHAYGAVTGPSLPAGSTENQRGCRPLTAYLEDPVPPSTSTNWEGSLQHRKTRRRFGQQHRQPHNPSDVEIGLELMSAVSPSFSVEAQQGCGETRFDILNLDIEATARAPRTKRRRPAKDGTSEQNRTRPSIYSIFASCRRRICQSWYRRFDSSVRSEARMEEIATGKIAPPPLYKPWMRVEYDRSVFRARKEGAFGRSPGSQLHGLRAHLPSVTWMRHFEAVNWRARTTTRAGLEARDALAGLNEPPDYWQLDGLPYYMEVEIAEALNQREAQGVESRVFRRASRRARVMGWTPGDDSISLRAQAHIDSIPVLRTIPLLAREAINLSS